MSPSVHRRSPNRRYSSSPSSSPVRSRPLLHRRSSPRRERSPPRRRSSPRARSPIKASSSHRARSPIKETLRGHAKSPDRARLRSPISRSPSPRIKHPRLEHEEHAADRERRRNNNRDGDKGRHNEKGLHKEVPNERRRGTSDDKSSKLRHGRSSSPKEQSHNHRSKYGSPPRATKGGSHDEATNSRGAEQLKDMDEDSVARMKAAEEALEVKQKQKPSFELSGKLAEETNRVRGVTLLFNEPPDARKPNIRWRLYVFKAGEVLNEPLYVHRQSCYLFGRERRVADVPTDHPSCSKQHAVIQFRLVEKEQPDGTLSKQVRPYLMDLGSTNGTFLNDNRIEPQRYYELMEKDTIKFGNSSREYVILHENSAG